MLWCFTFFQVKDSNITVFAVGVGDKVNSSTLETVASEPKEKHVFKMSGFDNLDISLATNILKTVSDTPAKVEVSISLTDILNYQLTQLLHSLK